MGVKNSHFKYMLTGLLCVLSALLLVSSVQAATVCAQVKIEIRQELTLERQAFDAMMRINNGLDLLSIEDVEVNVSFEDEAGNTVLATTDTNSTEAKFFIRISSMDNIADVSGNGSVAPETTAEVHWLIIPAPGAAEDTPNGKLFFVGATLNYTVGGEPESVEVEPDFINVKPLPRLTLDYFLTREVRGDDALTPEIEPIEPYTLGVRVSNNGLAAANSVKIDSAQPKIIENEQGLLIGFEIIGSTIDDQPVAPVMLIDFGTVAGNSAKVGRWQMTSTLAGEFVDFTATFSHADELGGELTSILEATNTHFLERDVRVDLPGRDGVRDFLALDGGSTYRVYESDGVDTVVTDQSALASFTLDNQSGSQVDYTLAVPVTAGFVFAKLPDPYAGEKVIKQIIRSDGKVIPLDNAWTSKTRKYNGSTPVWDYYINFFDVATTGSYAVRMDSEVLGQVPPILQFIPARSTIEGVQIGFLIEASDPNHDPIILDATPLPAGAVFIDNGDGTAFFNWTPSIGQAGTYTVTYVATDGSLVASRSATITVQSVGDSDGDSITDAWELSYFGSLDRDGSGDFDGDGISDLQEYLDNTDPTIAAPEAPSVFSGVAGDGTSTLSWDGVAGATGYSLYWSTESGVDKNTGELIVAVTSPFIHAGLSNDAAYYYVLTATNAGGESSVSAEVAVTPGRRDWGIPALMEQLPGAVSDMRVASSGNGVMLALWSQHDGARSSIWSSRYTAGSGWSVPELIEHNDTADAIKPQLALNASGDAIALWSVRDGVQEALWASTYRTATGWDTTPTKVLDSSVLGDLQVVLHTDGSAHIIWSQGVTGAVTPNSVWSSALSASVWSSPQRLDSASVPYISGLQLAADSSGNILATWTQSADNATFDLTTAQYTNGSWSASQLLRSGMTDDGQTSEISTQLAMNGSGTAMLVWSEVVGQNSIHAQRYEPGVGWESVSLLESDDINGAYAPDIALDESGNAVAVWQQSDGTRSVIMANSYIVGSGWDASARRISAAPLAAHIGIASVPVVAMGAQGDAIVAWQQSDGVQSNIWSNRLDPVTGWVAASIIEAENGIDAYAPQLAMEHDGSAMVLWLQGEESAADLLYNHFAIGNSGLPNINPIIVVPLQQEVAGGVEVMLDASGSFDQDGTVSSYQWQQTAGSSVVLAGNDSAILSFIAPDLAVPDSLIFALEVADNAGGISTVEVTVRVQAGTNVAPSADAGADQITDEQLHVSLVGGGSDPDGLIVSYQWTQSSGSAVVLDSPQASTTTFTAPVTKTVQQLVFQLTVVDDAGASGMDTVTVSINPVNDAPIVTAGVDQVVAEQSSVTLFATASDPDGTIYSYAWSQTGGLALSLLNADSSTVSFTAPAVYQDTQLSFRVVVTDDEGGAAEDTVLVTIQNTNIDNDTDTDGMGDLWELSHFGTLGRDGTGDADGDGITDRAEFESGTDPNVANGPGEPSVYSPDGVDVATLQPELVIENAEHHPESVITYQFELYSDVAMTQLVTTVSSLPEGVDRTSWQITTQLADNSHYYWRVRTTGSVLFSEWVSSSFFVNSGNDAPGGFNISSPQDGAWVDSLTPLLTVTNSQDIDGDTLTYAFAVYPMGASGSSVAATSGIDAGDDGVTAWRVDTPLSENQWYTWSSTVTDEHGAQTASSSANFFVSTANGVPDTPVLASPADATEIDTTSVELVVTNAVDPEGTPLVYLFELDLLETFDSSERLVSGWINEGNATTATVFNGLRDNSWYFWRAKASDGMATSAWVRGQFFVNTVNDAPSVPVPQNPGAGAAVSTLTPSLSVYPAFDPDQDALEYEFELYTTDGQGQPDVKLAGNSVNTTSWQVEPYLPEPGQYYWRVRAIDEHGAGSDWSDYVPFFSASEGINNAPEIELQSAQLRRKTERIILRWSDHDPDSNAVIRLYYDSDWQGADGTLITAEITEDPDGNGDKYRWDVSTMPSGVYFIYAEIDDGLNTAVSYAPNGIMLGDGGGHPYIDLRWAVVRGTLEEPRVIIKWKDTDVDSNAMISLYYDTDDQGADGVLIASGITEDRDRRNDRYIWDNITVPSESYYIYAVIQDEVNTYVDYLSVPISIGSSE